MAFATLLVWRLRTGACGVGACGFWRYRMPPGKKKQQKNELCFYRDSVDGPVLPVCGQSPLLDFRHVQIQDRRDVRGRDGKRHPALHRLVLPRRMGVEYMVGRYLSPACK